MAIPADQARDTLRVGALVAVRHGEATSRPALVVAVDEIGVSLHVAGSTGLERGDEAVVAWSLAGRVTELRTPVIRSDAGSRELVVSLDGSLSEPDERRAVDRFSLVAEALLVIGDVEHAGRAVDLSLLGAGLVLTPPTPPVGSRGELLVHDAGEELLPGSAVTVAHAEPFDGGRRVRVGVRFADANRVADATGRLLAAISGPPDSDA